MIKLKIGSALFVLASLSASSSATLIDFDGGTAGSSVGSFYSGLGVTFSDATFTSNFGLAGTSGGLGIYSSSAFFQPQQTGPIGASFSSVQGSVTLRGIDVGNNGFILKAYNAANVLIDSDTFTGVGVGVGTFADLTVTGAISRIEFSQISNTGSGDGMLFENLEFSRGSGAVPGPAAPLVFVAAAALRRRRQK